MEESDVDRAVDSKRSPRQPSPQRPPLLGLLRLRPLQRGDPGGEALPALHRRQLEVARRRHRPFEVKEPQPLSLAPTRQAERRQSRGEAGAKGRVEELLGMGHKVGEGLASAPMSRP